MWLYLYLCVFHFLYHFFGFLFCNHFHNKEENDSKRNSKRQADKDVLNKAGNYVHNEGNSRNADSVGKLGRNVVNVLTLAAGRRHNCCVGDG